VNSLTIFQLMEEFLVVYPVFIVCLPKPIENRILCEECSIEILGIAIAYLHLSKNSTGSSSCQSKKIDPDTEIQPNDNIYLFKNLITNFAVVPIDDPSRNLCRFRVFK